VKKSHKTSDTSYDVGYRKPPKANQFRKGQTGNPRGRTPGDENILSEFRRYVSRLVKINEGGEIKTVTIAQAVLMKNINAAMKSQLAMGNVFRLAEQAGEFVDRTDPKQVGMPIAVPIRAKNMTEFLAEFGRSPETE
jgi:Family of unknown function (DUF5681)